MRIILAGIIGRYPWGGVTWCSLMYLLGLRRLGHEVWYLEDTGECNYDPELNAVATDPGYALRYMNDSLAPFGFGERWCYVDYQGGHHGIGEARWREICGSADLFLVLSGGCWNWREHYRAIPVKAFIDSDPAFTQLALAQAARMQHEDAGKKWYCDYFRGYDRLFTFGANIGTARCEVPVGEFHWIATWQPVCLDHWRPLASIPPRRAWSTVMTWQIESFSDIGGNKDREFGKVLGLAGELRRRGLPEVELAISRPQPLLNEAGWRTTPAFEISSDLWRYHQYIRSSRGEFSVAKHTYVRTRSGWFSDRTECYLAAGRPAVVQDTGFSEHLPTGAGLHAWNTAEEALAAIEAVEGDWERQGRQARELAAEYFAAEKVLAALIETCDRPAATE